MYTKFKALAKFSVSNRDKVYIKNAKEDLKVKYRTGGDTPKRGHKDKIGKFVADKMHSQQLR